MLCFQFAVGRIRSNSNLGQGYATFLSNGLKFRAKKMWLITDSLYLVFHLLENTVHTLSLMYK
jgi:hypothetical protein